MEAFKSWWAQASSRDQLSVVILAVCAVFFILFQFIYNPISSMRSEQEQRVASQRDAYDRVKANQGLKMKDVSVAGTPSPGVVSASILIQKNQ